MSDFKKGDRVREVFNVPKRGDGEGTIVATSPKTVTVRWDATALEVIMLAESAAHLLERISR